MRVLNVFAAGSFFAFWVAGTARVRMKDPILVPVCLAVLAFLLLLNAPFASASSGNTKNHFQTVPEEMLSDGKRANVNNLSKKTYEETADSGLLPLETPHDSPGNTRRANPIGEWKFDGNGNNEYAGSTATLVNNATFETSGGISKGYAKIPTNNDAVSIPHNALYDLPNTFTIEFWFRQRSDQNFSQELVFKGDDGYNFRIYRLLWDEFNNGAVIAGYTDTGEQWKQVSSANDLAHGVWHYVAYVKDATSHRYYLDGNLTNSQTIERPAIIIADQPISIGTTAVDTDIDELRISAYAKTAEEISSYYNSIGTYYVNISSGSDSNDGKSGSPWKTGACAKSRH